jgi:hypothetical protein
MLPSLFGSEATGTTVVLSDFDPAWFRGLTAKNMALEVERHFEALLQRKNLVVSVTECGAAVNNSTTPTTTSTITKMVHACQPFDYNTVPGARFVRSLPVTVAGKTCAACVFANFFV